MKVKSLESGNLIASGSLDGTICIYDTRTNKVDFKIEVSSGVNDLLYDQGSQKLYASLVEGLVGEIDLRNNPT